MIPYGRQDISKKDIDYVVKVLKSDFITQGPAVTQFESKLVEYVSAKHCVVTNSATSALHAACQSLDIVKGDIVWAPAISFVATSNAALYCGSKIEFLDIDPDTFNICTYELAEKLKAASKKNKLPKLIIAVHMCGQSAEMKKIHNLKKKYGFKIIEDASHAIGASFNGNKVGSCKYSDLTVFSFHPVKIITTGEGGAVLTNDSKLASKVRKFVSHGVTKNIKDFKSTSHGPWYYEQQLLGYNYRMTDIQAALGISQLKKIDTFVNKRNIIAERYNKSLKGLQLDLPMVKGNSTSSYHLYVIQLKKENAALRDELFRYLLKKGIHVNIHYIPIYKQPFYSDNYISKKFFLKNCESYYSRAISIPIYPSLTIKEQKHVIKSIKDGLILLSSSL